MNNLVKCILNEEDVGDKASEYIFNKYPAVDCTGDVWISESEYLTTNFNMGYERCEPTSKEIKIYNTLRKLEKL